MSGAPLPAPKPSARARAARAWRGTCLVLSPGTTARDVLVQFALLGQRFCIRDGRLASAGQRRVSLTEATIGSVFYDELVRLLLVEAPF